MGLGVSGKSAASAMLEKELIVYAYDDFIKDESQIPNDMKELGIKFLFSHDEVLEKIVPVAMKSPGIKPHNGLIQKLKAQNTKIISDIELGFIFKGEEKIIAITGTNGKTTTTVLTEEILKACGLSAKAVGNIGVGAVSELIKTKNEFLVLEASSFQLDDIDEFMPDLAVLTNISSDHLDYHGSKASYKAAKLKILKNLRQNQFAILNYDDPNLRELEGDFKRIYVSAVERLDRGIYLDEGKIIIATRPKAVKFLDIDEIKLKGLHNYYNVMVALAISEALGLDRIKVKNAVKEFQGVAHRLQFVREFQGVSYYNDSKGTNADSTIKALSAFNEPIIIFLGGYEKEEDFSQLLSYGKNKIKAILAIGQTGDRIIEEAEKLGYNNLYKIDNYQEGLEIAKAISEEGDVVLLSPACASWDMYKNFEERGNEFIDLVEAL